MGKMYINENSEMETCTAQKVDVPLWEKYLLTIEEAAEYFRIGQLRLRNLVKENPEADFFLTVGCRTLIKRKKFEDYIDASTVI